MQVFEIYYKCFILYNNNALTDNSYKFFLNRKYIKTINLLLILKLTS